VKNNYCSVNRYVRILFVVDAVSRDINHIGRATAKIKAAIRKHEIKNRKIDDTDSQHGNIAHKNLNLEHNVVIEIDLKK
jgi:uncharacterized protein with HEPN domain